MLLGTQITHSQAWNSTPPNGLPLTLQDDNPVPQRQIAGPWIESCE